MKCSNCGKSDANIKYKQNVNGEETSLNLCSVCAEKLNLFNNFEDIFSPMIIDLDYILPEQIKCKTCGYTLTKYKSTGLLGCAECYSTFRKEMDSILQKIQLKTRHIPEIKQELNEIENLRNKLKGLIEKEEFEEAAKIRDEIKKIEE